MRWTAATGRGVRVAVVDSGRDPAWNDPRLLPGVGLVDPERPLNLLRSADDRDRIGHGTACCDVILRLAPGVEIVPIRVFGDQLETSPEVLLAALECAVEQEVAIVNLSLGTREAAAREALDHATRVLRRCGLLLVAALPRGEELSYPAAFPHVVGVEAAPFEDPFDLEYRPGKPAQYRARGACEARWLGGEMRRLTGASIAAPHVTALTARLRELHPGAGPDELCALLATASPAPGRQPAAG